eukprot:TRINITY_DN22210_c0_g1_i1.p1 TRINITY_DN22210_c0_g1~~TRINITY_DN22210_c0_g1_i1.p1  ORF type:complete len:103 (-),score=39.52 TRINITY_DN22210_c0_g1_i1:186-455(-)
MGSMEKAIKIVMVLLIMMTRVEAQADLENLVMEMRMEMNELRSENLQLKKDLTNTKDDLTITTELMSRSMEDLAKIKETKTYHGGPGHY